MQTIKFEMNKEVELPQDCIDAIPHNGRADQAVMELRKQYNFECAKEDAVAYLLTTGGWDKHQLEDHDENLDRLVWISCLDCNEQKTKFWYMGA